MEFHFGVLTLVCVGRKCVRTIHDAIVEISFTKHGHSWHGTHWHDQKEPSLPTRLKHVSNPKQQGPGTHACDSLPPDILSSFFYDDDDDTF